MAKVKGSKQHSMVVKHHEPHKRWLVMVVAFFCAVAVCVVGFLFGQSYERQAQTLRPGGQQMLEQLRDQIAELEQGHQVDQVAVESTRQVLKEKEEKIRLLEKNLAFYKGVMAPENNAKGLQVDRLGVEKTGEAKSFRIKWVLTQAGKNSAYLSGDVSLKLVGKQAGAEKVLSLKDMVSEVPNMKFKFRYFQSFSVQIELPEQFVAEKVLLSAASKGAKPQNVTQQYDWVVQETVVDVE
jgi:Family of unknown function (DUF6776)